MTSIAILFFLVAGFASIEAKRDADEIDRRIKENLPSLEHGPRWRRRFGIVAGLCFGVTFACFPVYDGVWPALRVYGLLLIASAFLFSACFRLLLNKRRGKHWAYIAPWSNVYDRVWVGIAQITSVRIWKRVRKGKALSFVRLVFTKRAAEVLKHGYIAYHEPEDLFPIHRAGLLMTITEILITAAALVGLWYFK